MANKHSSTPATQNEAWGFWGTWSQREPATTKRAWAEAVDALVTAGFTAEEARKVLDSRVGRHLADQCNDGVHMVGVTIMGLVAHKGWMREMRAAAAYVEGR